ncbi:hypothetical protein [Syntrophus aciditrophicus]|nr:hypothetical protein [Syntrophus aciditrophicus]
MDIDQFKRDLEALEEHKSELKDELKTTDDRIKRLRRFLKDYETIQNPDAAKKRGLKKEVTE